MSQQAKTIGKLVSVLVAGGLLMAVAVAVLVLGPAPVKAWGAPCDFLTGGGWIVFHGAKATFGVGGGCKFGLPDWGHLEYIDHGTGLNVHGTGVTGYFDVGDTGTDPKTGQPTGSRIICGTATTNQMPPNDSVNYAVFARDAGEPGVNDQFDIRVKNQSGAIVEDTFSECYPGDHYLGSYAPCSPGTGGGGNIQLHKPNASTTGSFGGSCPGL